MNTHRSKNFIVRQSVFLNAVKKMQSSSRKKYWWRKICPLMYDYVSSRELNVLHYTSLVNCRFRNIYNIAKAKIIHKNG